MPRHRIRSDKPSPPIPCPTHRRPRHTGKPAGHSHRRTVAGRAVLRAVGRRRVVTLEARFAPFPRFFPAPGAPRPPSIRYQEPDKGGEGSTRPAGLPSSSFWGVNPPPRGFQERPEGERQGSGVRGGFLSRARFPDPSPGGGHRPRGSGCPPRSSESPSSSAPSGGSYIFNTLRRR